MDNLIRKIIFATVRPDTTSHSFLRQPVSP
jgi:hypothetical protein